MKIVLKGYIIVPDEDLDAVRSALDTHIALTRAEDGCLVFSITADEGQSNRYDVYEEFRDRDAFELHQQRVAATDWGKVTRNVTRHYEIDEVPTG